MRFNFSPTSPAHLSVQPPFFLGGGLQVSHRVIFQSTNIELPSSRGKSHMPLPLWTAEKLNLSGILFDAVLDSHTDITFLGRLPFVELMDQASG
jgi:hypothetical protein